MRKPTSDGRSRPSDVGSFTALSRSAPYLSIRVFYQSDFVGGAEEDRTPDLLRARQALSQLSYGPFKNAAAKQLPKTGYASCLGGSGWI